MDFSALNSSALNRIPELIVHQGSETNTLDSFIQTSSGSVAIYGVGNNTEVIVASGNAALAVIGIGSSLVQDTTSSGVALSLIGGLGDRTLDTFGQIATGKAPITGTGSNIDIEISSGSGIVLPVLEGVGLNTVDAITGVGTGEVINRNLWDTSQGIAKGYAKFTPMQDGEPVVTETRLASNFIIVNPIADSQIAVNGLQVNISAAPILNLYANGYAPIKTSAGVIGYFQISPIADCHARLSGHAARARTINIEPYANAIPMTAGESLTSSTGIAFPWGVRNPSDEELITLILESRKRRYLTQTKSNGITRA